MKHILTAVPQPIADQWMAQCACGWRAPVSAWQFDSRDAIMLEIDRLFAAHVSIDDGKPQP